MWKRWLALLVAVGIGGWFLYARLNTRYCWFVFGPEGETRILVRLKGESVLFDGDFDARCEHFSRLEDCTNFVISPTNREQCYVITSIRRYAEELKEHLLVSAEIRGRLSYQQYADVALERTAGQAAMAHFDGPLKVQPQTIAWNLPPDLALYRGEKPTDFRAVVGTLDAQQRCWTVVRSHYAANQPAFPTNVFPIIDAVFPGRDRSGAAVTVRYALNQFC